MAWTLMRIKNGIINRFRSLFNRIVFYFRWEWMRKPPFKTRYFGYKLFYRPKDAIIKCYACWKEFEPHVTTKAVSLLKPNAIVFDVGANIGTFSLAILKNIPDSHIHMFEPSPIPRELLSLTLDRNRLNERCRLNPYALYSEVGEMEFCVHKADRAAWDGLRDTKDSKAGNIKKIRVPVTTLDHYQKQFEIQKVDLIKMDAEGAEYFILKGAANLLRICRPFLIFEVGIENMRPYGIEPLQLYDLLTEYGYSVHSFISGEVDCKSFADKCVSEHEYIGFPREQ